MTERKILVTLEVTVSNYTHAKLAEEGLDVDEIEELDGCDGYPAIEIAGIFEADDRDAYTEALAGSNLFIHVEGVRVLSAEDAP